MMPSLCKYKYLIECYSKYVPQNVRYSSQRDLKVDLWMRLSWPNHYFVVLCQVPLPVNAMNHEFMINREMEDRSYNYDLFYFHLTSFT